MINNNKTLLGAHMSIIGGFDQALYKGSSIGCNTVQIFTHSNRQWHIKPLNAQNIYQFKEAQNKTGIMSVIAHSSYLINLGSSSIETQKKSIRCLTEELNHCSQLGISYLVLHPGSGYKDNPEQCLSQIAHNIDIVFNHTESNTFILLENMAGQGSSVCSQFEQISYVINTSKFSEKLGVCFDTCHAFAAGYNFAELESYETMWKNFDDTIGLEKIKVLHINDSKTNFNRHVDRHAPLGKGTMTLEPFKLIMNDPRFIGVPKIIETPVNNYREYERELEILIRL